LRVYLHGLWGCLDKSRAFCFASARRRGLLPSAYVITPGEIDLMVRCRRAGLTPQSRKKGLLCAFARIVTDQALHLASNCCSPSKQRARGTRTALVSRTPSDPVHWRRPRMTMLAWQCWRSVGTAETLRARRSIASRRFRHRCAKHQRAARRWHWILQRRPSWAVARIVPLV